MKTITATIIETALPGLLLLTLAADADYKRKFLKKYVEIWNSVSMKDGAFVEGVE